MIDGFRRLGDMEADKVVEDGLKLLSKKDFFDFILSIGKVETGSLPSFAFDFINDHCELPSFASFKKIESAKSIFDKYQAEILIILYGYSLPYCYLAARDAEVLLITQRLKNEAPKRLAETAQFLLNIFKPDSIEDKTFFYEIIKVRLLHAFTRYSILHFVKNFKEMPINQEAMVGTNLAFSLIALRGLKRLGVVLSTQEEQDFFHFWAVVGSLMGVDADILPLTLSDAATLDRFIVQRHFQKSEVGNVLATALIESGKANQEFDNPILKPEALFSHFLGENYMQMLGLSYQNGVLSSQILSNINILKNYVLPTSAQLSKNIDNQLKA